MLEGGPCAFTRNRITHKPPADVIGHVASPRIYHGLDWDKTYTYVEARPHIAKALIGWMGKTRGGLIVGDEWQTRCAVSSAIVFKWGSARGCAQRRCAAGAA